MDRTWIALTACLLSLPGQPSLLAQQRPAETFGETIDVRVVNIETVVTDGKGNRISGLGPDDFRLLVNGREVAIDFFSEIREGRALASTDTDTVAAVLPAADANVPDSIPTNYLVFVEDVFPRGAHRNLVLERLAQQIDLLGPGDRMAVMAFDGRRLEVLADWTRSSDTLLGAFDLASRRSTGGAFRDMERRSFASGTEGATAFTGSSQFSQATGYASLLEGQLRSVIGAASTAIRVAGLPEGRRVMLLLAGGWPWEVLSPAPLLADTAGVPGPGSDFDVNYQASMARLDSLNYFQMFPRGLELYEMLTDTANRLSYTLYPIDVPGIGGNINDVTAEMPAMTASAASLGGQQESLNEATLSLIANQTGGQALLNDLRLAALDRAVKDTRTYYWLGFQLESQGDNSRHDIRVTLRQRGLEARARRGFVDLSADAEAALATEAALYLRKSNDSGLIVTTGEIRMLGAGLMEVPLRLSIPIDEITIMPVDEGWAAFLEVLVRARDDRQELSDLDAIPVNLLSRTEPAAGSRTSYQFAVTLRREPSELAITLRDFPSEKTLTAFARVEP